jgi:hypothetical protein
MCPNLSLVSASLVKNRGLEPFHTFYRMCPMAFLLFLIMSMYITCPGNKVLYSVVVCFSHRYYPTPKTF